VWLAIALIAVLLAANACWLVNLLTLVSESVSARNVATLIAFSAIGGSLGGILSTLFIGRTVETFGYGLVFYLLGSVHLIAFIVLILCRRWHTSSLKSIM
jgi:ACS family hexuronate transporter-like MFS transporter